MGECSSGRIGLGPLIASPLPAGSLLLTPAWPLGTENCGMVQTRVPMCVHNTRQRSSSFPPFISGGLFFFLSKYYNLFFKAMHAYGKKHPGTQQGCKYK